MSVSLVKVYFTAGWAMPGCLPDRDTATPVFASPDDAREFIASELDRAADELFQVEFDNAILDYNADGVWPAAELTHADSASMNATAELVRNDRDGDVTWQAMRGEWSSSEPDGYVYFIGRI